MILVKHQGKKVYYQIIKSAILFIEVKIREIEKNIFL